jgi:hypothetical protein
MAPIPKRKTERAPAIDKLLKPAIGVAIALVAYYSFTGLDLDVRFIILDRRNKINNRFVIQEESVILLFYYSIILLFTN